MQLPTRLDRYPAKMVSRLADKLVERYACDASRILDPFCGSGAVLMAANRRGIPVSGVDVNPLAMLLAHVKLNGFSYHKATRLANDLVGAARDTKAPMTIQWPGKHYWFTPATLNKFERLRYVSHAYGLTASDEGMAVLLSLSLSVRLCSKADQRSPKPFISKRAKASRKGKHFDPYLTFPGLLEELAEHYSGVHANGGSLLLLDDVAGNSSIAQRLGKHSHLITSPPYINAQDYFRNFKLELYLLEGLLPFRVNDLRDRFIGTERGNLLGEIPEIVLEKNYTLLPCLKALERRKPRLAAVVHRYLHDMGCAFDALKQCLEPKARFILVCGDNLIGGIRICTWQLLRQMLEERGFRLFDMFSDKILDRMLAPKRCGHKGLIKEEVVCAFEII